MRLGTKILILTLTITLALAGIIVSVATRDLTGHETQRARADIRRAVKGYFDRIDALHDQYRTKVTQVIEDPQIRSQLELLDGGDESVHEQFRLLFREFAQANRAAHTPAGSGSDELPPTIAPGTAAALEPVFHVLLNFEGRPLLSFAPEDPGLADALTADSIEWPYERLLDEKELGTRRYLWAEGALYLALGMPLRMDVDAPPSHAYFIGYRIDGHWATALLGEPEVPEAAEGGAESRGATPPRAWFLVDDRVVARSADVPGGAAVPDSALAPATAAAPPDVNSRIEFEAAGEHFVGEAVAFELQGGRRGALAVASSMTAALAPLRHLQGTIAWVTVGVIVVAVIAFRFVSNLIARPVGQLVAGTQRVARGEFDQPIEVNRRDELGALARSFNEMAKGLQQRDLVKSTFGRFVDPRIVEGFLTNPERLMPGGDKRVQTVLFSDLMSFTSISERLDADDLVALLNGYLGDAADVVTGTRGIVDKFIGDAVVAFWGPPITGEAEHAALACRAALRIVRGAGRHDAQCVRLGIPPLRVRVGIATGEVLVGLIGSSNKFDYTVMGDTANLGSRVEGLNKLYGTSILATARTAREAGDAVITRCIDTVRVVGRAEPVELYEVLAESGEEDGVLPLRCEAYAEAAARYQQRHWSAAATAFARVCREWPDDGAARAMAQRCAALQASEPAPDWDGVWVATSK